MKYLILSLLFISCNHGIPFFAEWVEPEPAEQCELVEYTSPLFITGRLTFDSVTNPIVWMNGSNPVDLNTLFPNHKYFQLGKNVAVIVNGTNNSSAWSGKIWARDGFGAKNYLSFSRQSLSMGGSVTYQQMKDLQTEYKSVYWMNFKGFTLDSLQYDTLISFQVDSFCKKGRERIDLRGIPVAQSRIDQAIDVKWKQVIQ